MEARRQAAIEPTSPGGLGVAKQFVAIGDCFIAINSYERDMWKPPFRVKRYANDKYKFLVRGKVDGKWKRRYFATESEAVAFAEQQNAAAERALPEPFQENGAPRPAVSPFSLERLPRLQLSHDLDFADLTTPVYLGPRIERYLGDSWCMHLPFAYDLMRELAPKVFVELGVKQGESYFAFCQSAAENKINVRCYGVDSWRGDVQTGNLDPEIEHEVARYNWRYSSFSELKLMLFAEALSEFADGSIDLLHIDGTHTYSDVRTDFESWLPKLSPKGVILFHDVVVRDGGFGVWKVWEEITGEDNSFLFEFGHGLGVWKKEPVTPSDPAFLYKLMTANAAEKRDLNLFYANAAAAVAIWHDLKEQPEAELSRLRQQAEEKESQITELQREAADSKSQIAQLQLETAEKAKDRAELAKDLAELQRTAEAKSAEIRELGQRTEKLTAEANQLRELANQLPALQRENDKQLQLVETLTTQVERKDERLAQLSKELMDAQWDALTLRAALLRKTELPDTASSRVLDLENRAEVAESDRDHLRGMVIGLQRDLEQAQNSRQSSLEELRAAQDDLKAAQEELKAAQEQLKRSTDLLRQHEKQMSRLRRDISGRLILPFGRSQQKIQRLTAVTRTDD
jgi:hypothetical protein